MSVRIWRATRRHNAHKSLIAGIILGMGSANERRRYNVRSPLIRWVHTHIAQVICGNSKVYKTLRLTVWRSITNGHHRVIYVCISPSKRCEYWPNDAAMRQKTLPSLVPILACRLADIKPLSEPILVYWSLVTHGNRFQWNLKQNTKSFMHENDNWNTDCKMATILSPLQYVK